MPARWQSTRARILRRDPICRIAGPGCTIRSTEVDHITRGAGDHDANLQGVCHACHQAKTQAEAAAARRR
jgi:5-methylcytosine-specific restriction endonuclease McrA